MELIANSFIFYEFETQEKEKRKQWFTLNIIKNKIKDYEK